MVNKAPEISSNDVIRVIKETRENGFDKRESKRISEMMKDLSPKDLGEVKAYIKKAKIEEPARNSLAELMEEAEKLNNLSYGFDGIKDGNKSEFFGRFLERPDLLLAIKGGLLKLRNENIEKETLPLLSNETTEAIDLVLWNAVVTKVGIMSGSSYMMKRGVEKATGFVGGIKDVVGKGVEKAPEMAADFDIQELGKTFDELQEIFEGNDENKEEKGGKALNVAFGYLSHLTKDGFENLNNLFALAKEKNINIEGKFQNILKNPMVLKDILENGKTERNGLNIDIKNKKIEGLGGDKNLEADKKAFMKEIVGNTNQVGGRVDGLKGKAEKLAGMFHKFGFDSTELKQFKEDLNSIPLIGPLLAAILGFFLGDNVFDALDKFAAKEKYKKPLAGFTKYLKSSDKALFILDKEANEKDSDYIVSFIKTVEKQEQKLAGDQKVEKSVILEENFWNTVFSKETKENENPIYTQIRTEIKKINPSNDEISQRDYLIALKNVKFVEKKKEEPVEKDDKPVEKAKPKPVEPPKKEAPKKVIPPKVDEPVETIQDTMPPVETPINLGTVTTAAGVVGVVGTQVAGAEVLPNPEKKEPVTPKKEPKAEELNPKPVEKMEPKEKEKLKEKREEAPKKQINKPKTLEKQLAYIDKFPFSLNIDGKKVEISITSDKKGIDISGKKYDIEILHKWWGMELDVMKEVFLNKGSIIIETIQEEGGKDEKGKDQKFTVLSPNSLATTLRDLIKKGKFENRINSDTKITIS